MMKRIILLFAVFCLCCSFVFAAETNSDESNSVSFTLVVNKSGVTQFFFCEPGNSSVRRNSLSFDIMTNPSVAVTESVGVYWSLFPEGDYSDATQNLRLVLEAASSSAFSENTAAQDFMLINRAESSVGLNYDIDIQEGTYSNSVGNGFSPEGITISPNERDERIPASERMITLFQGTVGTNGGSGSVTLDLELNPPITSIENEDGTVTESAEFLMEGEYIGYLMLRVETYS